MTERAGRKRKTARAGRDRAAAWRPIVAAAARVLPPVAVVAAVVAAALGYKHAYYDANKAFLVPPEAIVIRGNATLTRAEVLQNFGLERPVNGFGVVRSDVVERLRTQSPLIKDVSLTYQPGVSLELWVEERTPLARLAGTPLPLVVDEDGVCFTYPRPRDAYPLVGGFDLPGGFAPGFRLPPETLCLLRLIAATNNPDYRLPSAIVRAKLLSGDAADGVRVTLADGRECILAWDRMEQAGGDTGDMLRRLGNLGHALRNPALAGKKHFNAMARNAVTVSD